ncbi:MAG: DUF962 domain-containing protein [Myxococcales bacterium]|nr:DUF962 domain-containing protein [Myxococcales bacterium]
MNPKVDAWFREYDTYHRHPMNRATHKIAIPLIVFHVVAMCAWLPLFDVGAHPVTLAHVAIVALTGFYLSVSVLYAVLMAVSTALCLIAALWLEAAVGVQTARAAVVGVAILAWVVQLAGHAVWEKRSPAFLRNLVQALVGPIYFFALLLGHWRAPEWVDPRAVSVK